MVFLCLEWCWALMGLASLLLAAFCALRPAEIERLDVRLKRLELGPWPDAIFGLILPGLLALYKAAQFSAFHSMADTANMLNVAWNTAHGDWMFASSMGGRSYLSVHFAFIIALLSPLLRLWASPLALILPQGAAVGLSGWAMYRGARSLRPGLPAWLAAALLISSPLFHGTAITFLDSVPFAPVLFLGACAFHERGRNIAAGACLAALLLTREQAPMTLFGVAAAFIAAGRNSRARALGGGLMAAAIALWFGEMALIERYRAGMNFYDKWGFYRNLGGSLSGVLHTLVSDPLRIARSLVWPPVKAEIAARTLLSFGLLPLAGGAAVLPAAATWLPQQLADSSSTFMRLEEHYGSMLLGPLAWSAATGLQTLWARPERRVRLAAVAALAIGINFLQSASFSPPIGVLPSAWVEAVPKITRCIPPQASLWVDEYLSPHFALRRQLRILPFWTSPVFESRPFQPDRVLLSRYWLMKADPAASAAVFKRLAGYHAICTQADLVVLARP